MKKFITSKIVHPFVKPYEQLLTYYASKYDVCMDDVEIRCLRRVYDVYIRNERAERMDIYTDTIPHEKWYKVVTV